MIKPKTFWLTISNTDYACKINKTDKLDYPLALSMPITSLSDISEPTELGEHSKEITITCGLAFSLFKNAKDTSEDEAKKVIKGYHLCISMSDSYLVDRQISPSPRDIGNSYYMSWWFDGASKISPAVENISFNNLKESKIILQIEGQAKKMALVSDYIHSPEKIISFLSKHITLKERDIISLGQTSADIFLKNDNSDYKILASIGGIGQFDFLLKQNPKKIIL